MSDSSQRLRRALETFVEFKPAILAKEFDADSPTLRDAFDRAEEALAPHDEHEARDDRQHDQHRQ